ncbi:MAG TPA: FAD-dependent oxidoreductase [Myxococcota bacterium]|nr:FAD-dependent oxidoreductase [Myxococcota bacterium]
MSARSAYDVLVAGGGTAGLAAACCAADLGARTLLVERAEVLGGNATLAWVHTICGLYLSAEAGDAIPANSGFPLRLSRALRAAGGAGAPERAGRVWVVPTFPPVLEGVAAHALSARSGLDCWLGAEAVSATLSGGSSESGCVEVTRGGTRSSVEARVVIDTTGDAAVGALAGAASDQAPADRLQTPSFIFRVQGAPAQELFGFGRVRWSVALAEATRRGALPPGCESVLVRPGREAGEAYVTLNLPRLPGRPFDPLDEEYLASLHTQARTWARAIVAFLRETRPSFAHCSLEDFPRRVGVRETRRLRGCVVVERDDVLRGRRRDDEVALSSWPIELWHDHLRARFEYPEGPCGIPLGALVSASHPRLGMAGRCLSASHEALGALRVIGTALATGEAIGVAAALAADRGMALMDVSPARVRSAVERLGEKDAPW